MRNGGSGTRSKGEGRHEGPVDPLFRIGSMAMAIVRRTCTLGHTLCPGFVVGFSLVSLGQLNEHVERDVYVPLGAVCSLDGFREASSKTMVGATSVAGLISHGDVCCV